MRNFDQLNSIDYLKALYLLQQSSPEMSEFTSSQLAKEIFKLLSDANNIKDSSLIAFIQKIIETNIYNFLVSAENSPAQFGFCSAKEIASKEFYYSVIFNDNFNEDYFNQRYPENQTLYEYYQR